MPSAAHLEQDVHKGDVGGGGLVAVEARMAPPHVRLRVEGHMLALLCRQAHLGHVHDADLGWHLGYDATPPA
jgi:hypothetical protein